MHAPALVPAPVRILNLCSRVMTVEFLDVIRHFGGDLVEFLASAFGM
jgi:hypothetical protein